MTPAIHAFGVAFPALRLPGAALAAAWGSGAGRGLERKPFCAFDEDAISLAVAAARSALAGLDKVGGIRALFLGSTTLPYEEKPVSATVVTAVIGHRNVRTVEVRGSCQAGLQALVLAAEFCTANPGAFALAIAADAPEAPPQAPYEYNLAAAGAAFLVGPGPGLAAFGTHAAVTIETFGSRFRRAGERFISDLELRSGDSATAIRELAATFKPDAVARLAAGAAPEITGMLQRAFGGVPDGLWPNLGDTGAAAAPVALADALETASPGETILAVAIGGGATALTLTRHEGTAVRMPSLAAQLASGTEVDYLTYLKHRRLLGHTGVAAG